MTAQYGPHRWSAGYHDDGNNDAFRGATFTVADLTGARFVDCDLTGVKIVDAWLVDVDVSGYVERLVVNGVDVTAFVDAELDRRHPERVQLREMQTPTTSARCGTRSSGSGRTRVARAERLPEPALHERVDGEWSFVETLRHLVFITDSWASRTVLDEPMPYHRLGLPQTAYAPADAAALGIDLDAARPSPRCWRCAPTGWRWCAASSTVSPTPTWRRLCTRSPAPGYPEETAPVARVPRGGDGGGVRAPPLRRTRPGGAGGAAALTACPPGNRACSSFEQVF